MISGLRKPVIRLDLRVNLRLNLFAFTGGFFLYPSCKCQVPRDQPVALPLYPFMVLL